MESVPEPKDRLLQDYYKRQREKWEADPNRRRLTKVMFIFYAVLILLAWGGIGIFLLLNVHTFIFGVLLLIAAAFFSWFYIKAVFKKPDYSKVKYKDIAGYMNFSAKVWGNPLITKFITFGWRRPIVAIFALSIILSTIFNISNGFFFILLGIFGFMCIFSIIFFLAYGIAGSMAAHFGSQEVKDYLKNSEVSATGWWKITGNETTTIGLIKLLYAFFHKTTQEEVQKKAQKELQRNAQKKYKTKFRRQTKTRNVGKPIAKKQEAV